MIEELLKLLGKDDDWEGDHDDLCSLASERIKELETIIDDALIASEDGCIKDALYLVIDTLNTYKK